MKKVNKQWYNQSVRSFKNGIKEEIRVLNLQYNRYFNYPQPFDVKNNISKAKIHEYLKEAVSKVGTSQRLLEEFVSKYTPAGDVKPDFKKIESFIKRNARKINNSFDIHSEWDVYKVIGDFFCDAKWQVPDTEANNDRIFNIVSKYCEIY